MVSVQGMARAHHPNPIRERDASDLCLLRCSGECFSMSSSSLPSNKQQQSSVYRENHRKLVLYHLAHGFSNVFQFTVCISYAFPYEETRSINLLTCSHFHVIFVQCSLSKGVSFSDVTRFALGPGRAPLQRHFIDAKEA